MDQSYDAVITRMQKYIKNTPESESLRFGLGFAEFCALRDILAKDMIADAFFLAFSYGRAKEPLHICPACGAVFLRRKKAFAFVADLNGGTAAKELSKEMIERRPMPI